MEPPYCNYRFDPATALADRLSDGSTLPVGTSSSLQARSFANHSPATRPLLWITGDHGTSDVDEHCRNIDEY